MERSAVPGRSARLHKPHDAHRRTPSWLEAAVELRLGKIRGRLAQDLVGLAQLTHLTFQRLDPLAFAAGMAFTLASIALGLAYPTAQCFGGTTDLGRTRANRCRVRLVVAVIRQYRSNRSLADFRGVLRRRLHGSIVSRVGASGKAVAVHCLSRDSVKSLFCGHGTLTWDYV